MWSCQILSYKQDCRHVCKPTFSDAVRRGKSISRYVLATCMVVVPLFTFYFMFQFCMCFHYTRLYVQIICLSSLWIKYQLWVSVHPALSSLVLHLLAPHHFNMHTHQLGQLSILLQDSKEMQLNLYSHILPGIPNIPLSWGTSLSSL